MNFYSNHYNELNRVSVISRINQVLANQESIDSTQSTVHWRDRISSLSPHSQTHQDSPLQKRVKAILNAPNTTTTRRRTWRVGERHLIQIQPQKTQKIQKTLKAKKAQTQNVQDSHFKLPTVSESKQFGNQQKERKDSSQQTNPIQLVHSAKSETIDLSSTNQKQQEYGRLIEEMTKFQIHSRKIHKQFRRHTQDTERELKEKTIKLQKATQQLQHVLEEAERVQEACKTAGAQLKGVQNELEGTGTGSTVNNTIDIQGETSQTGCVLIGESVRKKRKRGEQIKRITKRKKKNTMTAKKK